MDHIIEEHAESIDMEYVADSALDDIQQGVVLKGEIVTIDSEFAYVNVGIKSDGRIPLEEFKTKPDVGEVVEVMLLNRRLVDGVYQFSRTAAQNEKSWQEFLKWYEDGNVRIKGRVIEAKSKGKLIECMNITTFLPFSLAADLKSESATEDEYDFNIKSIDKKKKSVILSRKDYLDEVKEEKWNSFVENYKVGDSVEGTVVKFVEFGAFVRVDGIDGLLHRNDMSWKNVFKQRKILKLNEVREFVILSINREDNKLSLGLKQLVEDPWLNIDEKYKPGDEVTGRVVTITNIGAFVELDDDVEGFVNNYDLSWTRNNVNVRELLDKGDEIKLMILEINKEDKKLVLGYKQTQENPWDTIKERFPVGSVFKRAVKKVVKFGVFVELEDDIDGLIHVSDFSWDDASKEPSEMYRVGDEVEFKVLDIRRDERKIACGIKQLFKSPWEVISEKYPPRMRVEGVISGITQFGLFVKLEENVEGLVHVSEVSKRRIEDLEEHFTVGDKVNAVVLGVDVKKKRLSLSIKQLDMIEEKEELEKVLKNTTPNTVTIGDMLKVKIGE